MNRIASNSAVTLSLSIFQLLTGFFISVTLARNLDTDSLGSYLFLVVICTTSLMIVNPSIYSAINYYVSSKIQSTEQLWFSVLVSSSLLAIVAIALSVVSVLIFHVDTINKNNLLIYFIPVSILSGIYKANFSAFLFADLKFIHFSIISAVNSIFRICVLLVLFGYIKILDWRIVFISFSIIDLSTAIIIAGLSYSRQVVYSSKLPAIKSLIFYGIKVYPGRLSNFLSYRIDSYFISSLLGSSAYAIYGLSTNLSELIWQIPRSIGSVLLPNIGSSSRETAINTSVTLTRFIFFLSVLSGFGLWIILPFVVNLLYGEKYIEMISIITVLIPGIVTYSIFLVLEPFFQKMNRPTLPSLASFIGLGVNIFLNIILIPKYALIGAAIASSLSYSIQSMILTGYWLRLTNKHLFSVFSPTATLQLVFGYLVSLVSKK